MNKKVALALVLLIMTFGVVAAATTTTITIYSQGIACIEDSTTLSLSQGINTVRIPVPDGFVPESLKVESQGEVISQSFHPGGADSILSAARGKPIEVESEDGTIYRGVLISTSGGIALQDNAGTIHLIENPTRVSIAGKELELSPYLELTLSAATAGKYQVALTYLSTGFNWRMGYVGTLSADGKEMGLTGWVQLSNSTEFALSGANVCLVAGQVNQVEKGYAEARVAPMAAPLAQEAAFEYHLYTLPGQIDLPAGKTILVPYGNYSGIPVEKVYTFEGSAVDVSIKFVNDDAHWLGVPLPAGDVRLFQARPDGTIFIGADAIPHTPVGEDVSITPGNAFDITGTRVRTESAKLSKSTYRDTYTITLRNHKEEAVTVNVLEHPSGNTWKIISAGISYKEDATFVTVVLPYEKIDSHTVKFVAHVPANGESKVIYTVEYSY